MLLAPPVATEVVGVRAVAAPARSFRGVRP
jgi:hypothetical protein